MIHLHASKLQVDNRAGSLPSVARVTKNASLPRSLRKSHFLLLSPEQSVVPEGYYGYGKFEGDSETATRAKNLFHIPKTLFHLSDGDVLKVDPEARSIRVLYRKHSSHNAFLITERCNSFCLMCSQPPRDIDDGYIVDDIAAALPLVDPETGEIAITGGEPTLLAGRFVELVRLFESYLPRTALHVLSNGRNFKDAALAQAVGQVGHHDIMFGIPLYSDISDIHDFVVQADGAYDETIRGLLNLRAARVPIEIRIVIHKQTYERLPALAEFIARNLTFVNHVALMGLEMTGFTKANLEALWIDPSTYAKELTAAVNTLDRFRIRTSIYNHQLCLIPERIRKFSVKSISDWKNEYMPECASCVRMAECGGFFSSAVLRYSDKITPFQMTSQSYI